MVSSSKFCSTAKTFSTGSINYRTISGERKKNVLIAKNQLFEGFLKKYFFPQVKGLFFPVHSDRNN